jgi:N5-(cytidine 5'-diphosphoramidyl)-L-glutamine hydrolase
MKRIGVTQRVEVVPSYGERRDCLDQRWWALLAEVDACCVPVPNIGSSVCEWAEAIDLHGLILSGGNDLAHLPDAANPAPERDLTEAALLRWAGNREMPVLAVCRGLQFMAVHLGGALSQAAAHVAVRHPLLPATGIQELFVGYDEVNSYHAWALKESDLPDELVPQLFADDGTVEAVQHRTLPWIGVMWHPERELSFAKEDTKLMRSLFAGVRSQPRP